VQQNDVLPPGLSQILIVPSQEVLHLRRKGGREGGREGERASKSIALVSFVDAVRLGREGGKEGGRDARERGRCYYHK